MRQQVVLGQSRRRGQAGFSLIEIFIVVGLVVILATMASPQLRDMIGRYRLNSAARDVMGYMKLARILAVTRNTQVRMVFTEIDNAPASAGDAKGIFRLEQWVAEDNEWQIVNDKHQRSIPLSADCTYADVNEFCVDMKDRFPSISLIEVDIPDGGTDGRALRYGPDGFILNANSDFLPGDKDNDIRVKLANKRSDGTVDGKMLVVDRAGNVKMYPFKTTVR